MKTLFRHAVILLLCLSWTLSGRAGVVAGPGDDVASIDALLARVKPGESEVFIDDMGYKVSYLLERRDALLNAALNAKMTHPSLELAYLGGASKWPNGRVPYIFNANVTTAQRAAFADACAALHAIANVTFVPGSGEANYVVVNSSDVNTSAVGMQGGAQTVNIHDWGVKVIICHELCHALGFTHEQNRSDRDNYVVIQTGNIEAGQGHNFTKATTGNVTPYDFDSIMHYGRHDFAINPALDTITPLAAYEARGARMGQRTRISAYDAQGLVAVYGTVTPQPNLTVLSPLSWSDQIVVSTVPGSRTDSPAPTFIDPLYLSWNVVNAGSAAAGATSLQVVIDGNVRATFSVPALPANNGAAFVDFNIGKLTAANHSIEIRVDSGGVVTESDETDNAFTKIVAIGEPNSPNLFVGTVAGGVFNPGPTDLDPYISNQPFPDGGTTPYLSSDYFYVSFDLYTAGRVPTGPSTMQVLVDNVTRATLDMPAVGTNANFSPFSAGGIHGFNIGGLAAGLHTFQFKVDAYNTVAEYDETDNVVTRTIMVSDTLGGSAANLAVYALPGWTDKILVSNNPDTVIDGTALTSGGPLYVNCAAINNGVTASGPLNVSIVVDNSSGFYFSRAALSPGESTALLNCNIGTLAPGTHFIHVTLEGGGDSNLRDNEYTKVITVGSAPQPNLALRQLAGWPEPVVVSNVTGTSTDTVWKSNDILYVDWAAYNTGSAPSGPFSAQLLVDGVSRGTFPVGNGIGIAAGTGLVSADVNIGSLAPGIHKVTVKLDAGNAVAESSEADNLYTKMVTVIPGGKDFNRDGTSDILWQNTKTGARDVWTLRGGALYQVAHFADIPIEWQIAALGDLDGDNNDDILWQNTRTGDRDLWLMQGVGVKKIMRLATIPVAWQIAGIGDFNGDGKNDVMWQNSATGERDIWVMNGTVLTQVIQLAFVPVTWQIAAVGDLDGDGTSDLVWQNTSTGERDVWSLRGGKVSAISLLANIPVVWQIAGVGDFNGDGRNDIVWQNTQSGERDLWLLGGSGGTQVKLLGFVPAEWTIANH